MNSALNELETLAARWVACARRECGLSPNREVFNRNCAEYLLDTGWRTLAEYVAGVREMVTAYERRLNAEDARDAAWRAEVAAVTARLEADGKCTRCGGAGHLPQYDRVNGGVCFECDGTGTGRDGI